MHNKLFFVTKIVCTRIRYESTHKTYLHVQCVSKTVSKAQILQITTIVEKSAAKTQAYNLHRYIIRLIILMQTIAICCTDFDNFIIII